MIICKACHWIGSTDDLLTATNPFDGSRGISACPNCRELDSTVVEKCDAEDCIEPSTCGTPTADGYRHTCWNHRPEWL